MHAVSVASHRLPAALGLIAILALAAPGLAQTCTAVEGPFVTTQVPPPECQSPVLTCTHGELGGDIDGEYDFTMLTLDPNPSAEHPTAFTFTGESTITTTDGTAYAEDTGDIEFKVGEPSPFRTVVHIVDGDGEFAGVTGTLVATGGLDLVAGTGEGHYVGTLCRA